MHFSRRIIFTVLTLFIICLISYTAITYCQQGNYPDKLWLHRCNSIEKFLEASSKVKNIEVDVIYRNQIFDITHDEDTTFHLSLEDYFKIINKSDRKIWIDIKNLTEDNADSVFDHLNRLTEKYNIHPQRLVVESPNAKQLKRFTDMGYYTSIYVTAPNPEELTEKEIDIAIKQLQQDIDAKYACAISFPYWWYNTIKQKLDRDVDLLTWRHFSTEFEFLFSVSGRIMLNDPQLKIILIKGKSKYNR